MSFLKALIKEIDLQKRYLGNEIIETIYFGGGTPSVLSAEDIDLLFHQIQSNFTISDNVEITFEANPDDLTRLYLRSLKRTPVNRLSIGVQSFFEDDLKYLNRVHSANQAYNCVKEAQEAGFQNMSIDLIYGIPTLSETSWIKNLEIFFELDLPHLSAYALTVEPKTALEVLIRKQKTKPVEEYRILDHFKILLGQMKQNGYIHYEISNFAKEGFYSKHNSLYWLGGYYVGIGPSAHSFNGSSRQWNVSNMKQYIETEKLEKLTAEKEVLSTDQLYNEYVMTSLRTSWGCDSAHTKNVFGDGVVAGFLDSINTFLEEKKVFQTDGRFFLINKGKLFADGIAAALFR